MPVLNCYFPLHVSACKTSLTNMLQINDLVSRLMRPISSLIVSCMIPWSKYSASTSMYVAMCCTCKEPMSLHCLDPLSLHWKKCLVRFVISICLENKLQPWLSVPQCLVYFLTLFWDAQVDSSSSISLGCLCFTGSYHSRRSYNAQSTPKCLYIKTHVMHTLISC